MTGAVLCVDPSEEDRARTTDTLEASGLVVDGCGSLADARTAFDDHDAVVTELDLPDGTGFALVDELREATNDVTCVVFTDATVQDVVERTDREIVAEFVQKGDAGHDLLVDLVSVGIEERVQTPYPLPADEEARLEAVDDFADLHADVGSTLERVARIAAGTFDVARAAVGLVDETHQRFLACHGGSFDDVPRERTVCTYALVDPGTTVVEDLTSDPRLPDDVAVVDTVGRFYASANLVAPDGSVVGTVCVYDDEPRSFDGRERALLREIADLAMDVMVLARSVDDDVVDSLQPSPTTLVPDRPGGGPDG